MLTLRFWFRDIGRDFLKIPFPNTCQKAGFAIITNNIYCLLCDRAFPVDQLVKNLPAVQETPVLSLGQEDPMEKEMATYSSILAWRIPWTEELDGLQSMGHKELDTTERLHFHFHSHQDSMLLAQKQKYGPMEQDRNPRNKPMGTLFLTKEARIYNGVKTASSINGAGKTGQLHVKERN